MRDPKNITIARETFTTELLDALMPMFVLHWQECGIYKDKMPLDIDKEFYVKAEASGHALLYVIREDGNPVGYMTVLLNYQPHHRHDLFALVDTVYVEPAHRRGLFAIRFMQTVEEDIKQRGISVLVFNIELGHDYPALFKWMGYDRSEVMYTKHLKG